MVITLYPKDLGGTALTAREVRHALERAEDSLFCGQNIATIDCCFIF